MAYEQYKQGSTYFGYNPSTQEGIAFANQPEFNKYFSQFDPNAAAPTFDTSKLLANPNKVISFAKPTSAITPESLAPATPTPFVQPNPTPAPQIDFSQYFNTPELEATPTETKAQGFTDRLQALNEQLVGKSAFQAEQEKTAGVDTARKTVTDLTAQIMALNNEAKAVPLKNADAQATNASIRGMNDADLRTIAVKGLTLSSMLYAAQGNLANAQSLADKAVAAKYDPIQEQITANTNNLNLILNSPEYSRQDKNRAQKQLDIQNKQQAQLTQKIQDANQINQIAIQAASEGADAVTLQKIQNAKNPIEAATAVGEFTKKKENITLAQQTGVPTKFTNKYGEWFNTATGEAYATPEEFFKASGVKSFEEAYKKGLVTDITNQTLADRDLAAQAQAKYIDVVIPPNATREQIAQAIKGSRIYQKEVRPPVSAGGSGKGALASTYIVDANTDAAVKSIIASKPGNGGYGDAYNAVKAKYGKSVANAYDKVYQDVFNDGVSVDAAFNNAKLGDSATGLNEFDILAEAVSNKLGSVAAKNTFINQYSKAKTDEQRVKILAANAVLPAEIKTGIIQNSQVTRSLDDVLRMLDKGVQTGLLQAGQSYVANKLGTGADKEVEAIKSKLIAALQPYRNKVTGAAWGQQEEAEYQALIGSVRFSPDDLRNKLNVFKGTLQEQSQTALQAGIDPLATINQNSVLGVSPSFNTGSVMTDEQAYQEYLKITGVKP